MDFGDVIRMMKEDPSRTFKRKRWEDKYIVLNVFYTPDGTPLPLVPDDDRSPLRANIGLCEDGARSAGWYPDPSDMLAEDWEENSVRNTRPRVMGLTSDGEIVRYG